MYNTLKEFLVWNDPRIGFWNNPPRNFTWEDVSLITEILTQGGGSFQQTKDYINKQLDKEKKKRLIKIILFIRNPYYQRIVEEKEVRTDIKITNKDLKILLKEIKVKLKK